MESRLTEAGLFGSDSLAVVPRWRELAEQQAGVLGRWQLRELGRHSRLSSVTSSGCGRWARRSRTPCSPRRPGRSRVSSSSGSAVLHAGPDAMIGGLTAARHARAVRHWDREEVTVLVHNPLSFEPLEGVRFFRTRRTLAAFASRAERSRSCRIEPAVAAVRRLLAAAAHRSRCASPPAVQQGLSTAERFRDGCCRCTRCAGAAAFWALLGRPRRRIAVHGRARRRPCLSRGRYRPPRRQVSRTDRDGRRRYTDCEWDLPDGRGAGARGRRRLPPSTRSRTRSTCGAQRKLTTQDRIVVRCAAEELRYDPASRDGRPDRPWRGRAA